MTASPRRAGLPLDWAQTPRRARSVSDSYRDAPRTERCACGGLITAQPWTATEKVRAHQQEQRHKDWWATCGWDVDK